MRLCGDREPESLVRLVPMLKIQAPELRVRFILDWPQKVRLTMSATRVREAPAAVTHRPWLITRRPDTWSHGSRTNMYRLPPAQGSGIFP